MYFTPESDFRRMAARRRLTQTSQCLFLAVCCRWRATAGIGPSAADGQRQLCVHPLCRTNENRTISREMTKILIVVGLTTLVGCAGQTSYVRPATPIAGTNVKVIERPRETVWNASVPELGKQFFVINNLDKSSGLINISYTGDPEKYVDCGQITSVVKNAQGERTYQFPGARASQTYEVMDTYLYVIQRRMNLEGRVNLIFEELGSGQTRVTANTRYVLTKQSNVQQLGGGSQNYTDTLAFNSGTSASFPPNKKGESTECAPTGQLEKDVLAAIR